MTENRPVIVAPLAEHIPPGLERMLERARTGRLGRHDRKAGAELLVDAYCGLMDTTLIGLIRELGAHHRSDEADAALERMEQVKARAHRYVPWAAGMVSEKRLPPVIEHFNRHVEPRRSAHGQGYHMVMPLSESIAGRAERILGELGSNTAEDLDEGIELLCTVVDEVMVPLAVKPKNLLDFNVMVDKPLDGVIAFSRSMIQRMLRRMGTRIPRDMYPLLADHIGSFLLMPDNSGTE